MHLNKECLAMKEQLDRKLETATNVTLAVNGCTNISNESVYIVNVEFPDRTVYLLDVLDCPEDKHDANFLVGEYAVYPSGSRSTLYKSVHPIFISAQTCSSQPLMRSEETRWPFW